MILDFYVDEPACFGVPPYLSPYCRYTAGALVDAGIAPEKISYLTVDQWRAQKKELSEDPELLILIAGHTVPGKYLGGKIGSVAEILELLEYRCKFHKNSLTLLGGPIRYSSPQIKAAIKERGGLLINGDIELYAHRLAREPTSKARRALFEKLYAKAGLTGARRNYGEVERWAARGAFLSSLHPNFPYLMLELESYRGCTRDIFCSFCTEAFYGKPDFRSLKSIFTEVEELYRMGNRYFRLGRQADLLTYLPNMQDFQNSFPRPIPQNIARLYKGIRQAAPELKVLHLDNINPGLIAAFPEEARQIMQIISRCNTPGDTAAMGLESVDSNVIQINDLKCNAAQAEQAIEIVNEFGAQRENGISKILPGINLLHGLPGESEKSFEENYIFLKRIMERGLLLRRINIRQTVTYSRTKLEDLKKQRSRPNAFTGSTKKTRKKPIPSRLENKFLYWSKRIREEIDRPMLLLNFPIGTRISNVILESNNQGYIFGRPLGSYPVTIKVPLGDARVRALYERQQQGAVKETIDLIVTGAWERSLLALSYPIAIPYLDKKALEAVPGIGKRRSTHIFLKQPKNFEYLRQLTEGQLFGKARDYSFGVYHEKRSMEPALLKKPAPYIEIEPSSGLDP